MPVDTRHKTLVFLGFMLLALGLVGCGGGAPSQADPVEPPPTTAPTDLGESLDYFGSTLYYLPSVTQEEAQRLLDYLVETRAFQAESRISVQLRKENGKYEVWGGLREGIDINDSDVSDHFKRMVCDIGRRVFSGSGVSWIITDETYKNIMTRFICLDPTPSIGESLDHSGNKVFYLPPVTQQEAQRLLDYLVKGSFFPADTTSSYQLRKVKGTYEVRMPLKEGLDPNDSQWDVFDVVTCDIQTLVFPDSFVNWILVKGRQNSFDDITKRFVCSDPSSGFGENLDNKVFYLPPVTQQEAQRLLDYLVQGEWFSDETGLQFQLRKVPGVYEVRMGIKEGVDLNDPQMDLFSVIACDIGNVVFSGSSAHWVLVESGLFHFENVIKRFRCVDSAAQDIPTITPTETPPSPSPSPADVGENLDNRVFYLPPVTQQEAQRLLDYLVQGGFFQANPRATFQLRKEDRTYEVRSTHKEGVDPNDSQWDLFSVVACDIGNVVFSGSSANWAMVRTAAHFENVIKRFVCLDPNSGFGENLDNRVFYLPPVTQQEAQRLLDYLIQAEFFSVENEGSTVQLRKVNGVYEVRMPLKEGLDPNDSQWDVFDVVTCGIESLVFPGSSANWVLVDSGTFHFENVIKRFRCSE